MLFDCFRLIMRVKPFAGSPPMMKNGLYFREPSDFTPERICVSPPFNFAALETR